MSYHIPGSMFVGVTVWFGWGGVVAVASPLNKDANAKTSILTEQCNT